MHDLMKQQRIAKDSIRALETLGEKYSREKKELVVRFEKDREDMQKKE